MAMRFFILFLFPLFLFAKIDVTVSILPQKYFVEKIAGNLADVSVMVPPGSEPADYEPKPQQLLHLTKSKLYFSIGVPYEKVWLPRFQSINPNLIFVDIAKGIKKVPMVSKYSFENIKRSFKKVKKDAMDPHIWLSPVLVEKMVSNIKNAFIKADPKDKVIYQKNFNLFKKEIEALHLYGIKKLKNLKHKSFIVFHPVWGYFAKEFGLKQVPIQIEGKSPKISQLIKLIRYAKKKEIKVVFVQPEFSKKTAEVIAKSIGGKVVVLDPLEENWQEGMKKAIDTFSKVLKDE